MRDSVAGSAPRRELAVVMPVYNEQECIAEVLSSWRGALGGAGIDFVMLVFNDGSTDRTGDLLDAFAGDGRIRIIHQRNVGHGPTILDGYRQAVRVADWVFQCDSDDEIPPDSFGSLWESRGEADAVVGRRQDRRQSVQRRIVTSVSRLTVAALFGRGVSDVNAPYRLVRASLLRRIIECIPSDTIAPNLAVSGGMSLLRARVLDLPVRSRPRRSGRASLVRWGLWKAAVLSVWQMVRCRCSMRRLNHDRPAGIPCQTARECRE